MHPTLDCARACSCVLAIVLLAFSVCPARFGASRAARGTASARADHAARSPSAPSRARWPAHLAGVLGAHADQGHPAAPGARYAPERHSGSIARSGLSRRHQERHDSRGARSDPRAARSRLQRPRADHPGVSARARDALLQHRLRDHAAQRQPLDCRDDGRQREQPRTRRQVSSRASLREVAAALVAAPARARPRAAARRR